MRRFHALFPVVIAVLFTMFLITPLSQGSGTQSYTSNLNVGPFVDRIVYKVIANQDQRMLALQQGNIEMDTSFFDPSYLDIIGANPNISFYIALRNGYRQIAINCRDYPLNISGLRRAFAYAYNKTEVTEEMMNGFAIPHDSVVPQVNGWCVEDQFAWHYYDSRPDIGNQILDNLGFEINDITGFRLAPNGEPFNITIEYGACSCEFEGVEAQIGVDALLSLHIDASKKATDFNNYIDRLDSHGDYDMISYAFNFDSNDVDWLANEYWSEYADIPYQNPTNFVNATYDSWRDQLIYGTTYEEVYQAAAEMQKILQYNVPCLVTAENTYMQAYRNDQFTGYIEDSYQYISGTWTMRKIHNLNGSFGGTVSIALGEEPDSFNIFTTNSAYSRSILSELWPSLYKYSPDATPWPDLAQSMLTETHSDNPSVSEGHTRFTIDIVQNATWSDGVPLTAEDVAFTFTYMIESAIYGNPAASQLEDLFSVYAPSTYRVVFEFSTESYWHFGKFAFEYIIPEHIFNNENGIGYDGWETWNPVFDPTEPNVNCGPFIFTDFRAGEFYELTSNPLFHHRMVLTNTTTDTTVTSTNTTATVDTNSATTNVNQPLDVEKVVSYVLISSSIIVIVFCVVLIIKQRGE